MSESYPSSVHCPIIVLSIQKEPILGFDNGELVRNELMHALEQSCAGHVVLDLSNVRFLQSAGFRPLLSIRRYVHETRGGRVVLCHLQPDVEEVLTMTHMINSERKGAPFEFQPDVASAVASLCE